MSFLRTRMVFRSQDILLMYATTLQWKVPWGGHALKRFGLVLMIILHLSAQRHLCNVQRSRAKPVQSKSRLPVPRQSVCCPWPSNSLYDSSSFHIVSSTNRNICRPYLPPFHPLQAVRPACFGSIVFPDSMPRQNQATRMSHAAQSLEGI